MFNYVEAISTMWYEHLRTWKLHEKPFNISGQHMLKRMLKAFDPATNLCECWKKS